tara:strand:+ start:108 stop:599 length:492 start_codon:yes stop_codon:yes gene_type:complete
MKRILSISLICLLLSCKSGNSINQKVEFNIVQVPIIQENDTVISNELRFYKISSAFNSMQLMYDNYGDWDMNLSGRYQGNIPQLVWKDVNLIDDGKTYTISASGKETLEDFFTSFVILNANGLDALSEKNQSRELIVDYLKSRLKKLGNKKSFNAVYQTKKQS